MPAIREMPPRGHYVAQEVGFQAGVSGPMIGQWAKNGYIRSSQSDERPRIYSYQDAAEAMLVHELVDRCVPYSDIRRMIEGLRERYGADWPLTYSREAGKLGTFGTKRKRRVVFQETAEGGEITYAIGERKWQVMDASDLKSISVLLRRGGWPARRLKNLRWIEVDPDRLSGRPTIRGRRVAARAVAELANAGATGVKVLREEYDLTPAQIGDAQRWWKEAQRLARGHPRNRCNDCDRRPLRAVA